MMERFFLQSSVDNQASQDGKKRIMSGYAISYGVPSSRDWWGYTIFEAGAAEMALVKPDLECYSLFIS